jgi:hypothetical protein
VGGAELAVGSLATASGPGRPRARRPVAGGLVGSATTARAPPAQASAEDASAATAPAGDEPDSQTGAHRTVAHDPTPAAAAISQGAAPSPTGGRPLSFEQQRFWYLERSRPGDPTYNQPIAARLRGPLDPDVLRDALTEVLRRHPVLRAAVHEADGIPTQQPVPPAPAGLRVEDLRHHSDDDRDRELERRTTAASREPFDLARPPLLRATLYRRGDDDHVLLLVVHHIACDARGRERGDRR